MVNDSKKTNVNGNNTKILGRGTSVYSSTPRSVGGGRHSRGDELSKPEGPSIIEARMAENRGPKGRGRVCMGFLGRGR